MSHSLVEIPYSEWSKLLHLYKDHKKYSSSYSLILNYINWIKNDPEIDAKIYGLDGEWKNDGTFIVIENTIEIPGIYFNTLSKSTERLSQALDCLDANQTIALLGFQERLLPAVYPVFKRRDIDYNNKILETMWYHIERDEVLQFDVSPPEGITLSALDVKHAHMINELWPHRYDNSIKVVERLIISNDSVGAFDRDGNLVAWCLRLSIGALGLLQVVESHKRRGLGGLLVRSLSRVIALNGEEVFAAIVNNNPASCALFEKLGFHEIDKVYFTTIPGE